MAAGPDYKDDDDDDHDDGEYSPTNRSEHSYELYVEGAGRGHADPGSGVLPPHRRMSVFTEEDEEEALAAAAAEQEGRDRRVSGTKDDKYGEALSFSISIRDAARIPARLTVVSSKYEEARARGVLSTRSLSVLSPPAIVFRPPFLEMESPLRDGVCVRARAGCGCVDRPNYIFMPLRNSAVTTMALSRVSTRPRPLSLPRLKASGAWHWQDS